MGVVLCRERLPFFSHIQDQASSEMYRRRHAIQAVSYERQQTPGQNVCHYLGCFDILSEFKKVKSTRENTTPASLHADSSTMPDVSSQKSEMGRPCVCWVASSHVSLRKLSTGVITAGNSMWFEEKIPCVYIP